MELTPRKQAVLKAIVKAYIETGEPVGSKNLTYLLENAPSSATLRNEMSELCELGLLSQPHTSAGRVPTNKGYSFYINSLMVPSVVNEQSAEFIKSVVADINAEPESIPAIAAETLSRLTGLPTVACVVTEKVPRIKKIELLPIGKYSLMLLIVTDDGRIRNRILRAGQNFTDDARECFLNIIEQKIKGKIISELNKAYMQSVIAAAGVHALDIMPLLTAVFETVSEIENAKVMLKGENILYNMCDSELTARRIISLLKREEHLVPILEKIDGNIGALFGSDTNYEELQNTAIIAAKFSGGDKYKGFIGVIGPNRISYEQIMPYTQYTAKILTDIMTKAQKEMEE